MGCQTIHLRPSRTIEIVQKSKNVLFIYNYEGKHFRVFRTKEDIKDFLTNRSNNYIFETNSEIILENYIDLY